jgi:hypothetical protein
MWWNDAGAGWGWGGCLLLVVALLAFWGVVIAAVMALFGAARPQVGPTADALPGSRVDRSADTGSVGDVPNTPQRGSP